MQDATSLAAAIASGRTSAPEVMQATLEAATARAGMGATLGIDAERAMAAARQPHGGCFAGVPFLGKDLGAGAAAFPVGAGVEAIRRRSTPSRDSDLFSRFRAAGLVQAGLSTVPPFGLALTSDPARNLFDARRSPGGSSGGAAAAVTAGIVGIAHATDAAGSIRVPAACCGLYGLKPSRGAVPGGPDFGNHLMGLASELVLARSLRDVAAAFHAVAETSQGTHDFASPVRVALCRPARCKSAETEAAEQAAEALSRIGCRVTPCTAPDALGEKAASIASTILTASLAEWLDALAIPDTEIPPVAAAIAAEGRAMAAATLFAASRSMAQTAHALWLDFAAYDVILSPILADGPPLLGAFDFSATDPAAHFAQMEAIAPNAALANVAGAPALAMPFGTGADGIPRGIQLMSRPGTDAALLAFAERLAAVSPPITFPFPIAGHP